MTLLRSMATVGGLTMVSRVLGFGRDILIAAALGAGWYADVFFVAFKLPNLFRRLFAEGAFSAAFVPLFARLAEGQGKARAQAFAEAALSVLLVALLGLVAAVEVAMPLVMYGFAPGFAGDAARFDLAVQLSRITFPYLLFVSLVSLMAGILNSLGRFAAAAATPILLNLCLIGAVLVLAPFAATPAKISVQALAWGVAAAGAVQFLWLFWRCGRAGVWLRLRRPRLTAEVRVLLRRILPVAVGAGVYQMNLLIDTVIASFLPPGSISYLFFADRVNQLPLGVVGVAVGTALLPLLSRQVSAGSAAAAADSQNRAIEFACLLAVPAAAALMVIAGPLVAAFFQRGEFGAAEAEATAAALAVYAAGLPAYILIKALVPGYFARGDTATPVKISVLALAVNLGLNLALMGPFLHVGIAAATAASAWLNAGLLGFVLKKRGFLEIDARLRRMLPRLVLASAAMAALLALAAPALTLPLAGGEAARAAAVAALVVAGLSAFALLAYLTGALRPADVRAWMRADAA